MADIIFRSHKKEVESSVRSAINIGMEAVAQAGEANAIKEVTKLVYETPPSPHYIRTGDLRKSISHKYVSEEQAAYIGTNLEYAPYVEYGTRNMRPRPFLRNAATKYADEYKAILENALKSLG